VVGGEEGALLSVDRNLALEHAGPEHLDVPRAEDLVQLGEIRLAPEVVMGAPRVGRDADGLEHVREG
jgi:hypothetical protein